MTAVTNCNTRSSTVWSGSEAAKRLPISCRMSMFDAGRVSGGITIVGRPLPSAAWAEDAETDSDRKRIGGRKAAADLVQDVDVRCRARLRRDHHRRAASPVRGVGGGRRDGFNAGCAEHAEISLE